MIIIGTFAIRNSVSDVIIMITLGSVGWVLSRFGFAASPIVLGLILGPIAEQGFVQAWIIGDASGNLAGMFFGRLISLAIIAFTILSLVYPVIQSRRAKQLLKIYRPTPMTDQASRTGSKDIGTLIIASLSIGMGLVTLHDVTTYSDTDSVVFPRTVAYALIFCSVLVILYSWLRPNLDNGFGGGDWWRRILLVASMIGCCLFMPLAGFLPATAIAFAGGLIAARHEGWDLRSAVVFAVSGVFIMGAFYALFRYPLGVPLP